MTADDPLALYVHWPWCLAKCPYCDFNSHAHTPTTGDQTQYRNAILRELNYFANKTSGQKLTSIFFGGGTPSLMAAQTVQDIIEHADRHFGLETGCEITLEANPTSIEAAKFRAFQGAGINRVSVGVQALNDEDLQALGREHSVEDALEALAIADAIFERFTFDLIYARPDQGVGAWTDELEYALSLAGDHISLYQLTIEPGTVFFRQSVAEADEDLATDLFDLTQDMCLEAGLSAYEVSNHARPGQESRHNLTYWNGGDYIGIGPGAHGRLTTGGVTHATHQISTPARWLDKVEENGHATAKVRELSRNERIEELVLSGLRLSQGLDAQRFGRLSGTDFLTALNTTALNELSTAGLIELDSTGLRTTRQGRLMLNTIIQRLLDDDPEAALSS